jgi:transposase-like protein
VSNSAPAALPTQQTIQSDLLGLFRGVIALVLEVLLEQQVREMVGARRYERLGSRKDHLNGTYMRRFLTSMGLVELDVPRTRTQGSAVDAIGRYKRRVYGATRHEALAKVEALALHVVAERLEDGEITAEEAASVSFVVSAAA